MKKNNLALIGVIQSASYLLLCTNNKNMPKNHIQKKAMKKAVNQVIAAIKQDIRKLKRL